MATLKERMRAKRERMKEASLVESDSDTPRTKSLPGNETWAAAMEPGTSGADTTMEMEDEVKDSEQLIKTLRKGRKKTERHLGSALKIKNEDVSAQMDAVKNKTKMKVLDEAGRSATDTDDAAASSAVEETMEKVPSLDMTGLDDGRTGSPQGTSRSSARRPEDAGISPRKLASKNLGESMRARLSEKLRAAKDQGKDAAYKEKSGRKFKDIRSKIMATRFDDPSMKHDELEEAEEALQRSLQTKSRWRMALEKADDKVKVDKSSQSHMPSQEEQLDFFTRAFDGAAEEEKEPEPAPVPADGAGAEGPEGDRPEVEEAAPLETPQEPEEEESTRKKAKTEEEEPLLDEQDSWRAFVIGKARYTPFHEKMKHEEKLYFYPSLRPAPINEKIAEAEKPRFLEEEGFYVGVKPNVASSNLNKMENRLLKISKDKGKYWFGEDGRLIALPDPLKEIPSRPPIPEEIPLELQPEYKKAYVVESKSKYLAGRDVGRFQLDVDVNTIQFTHHHLFSREHVLATRLTEQYEEWCSRDIRKTAAYLTEKLMALKSAYNHVKANIEVMVKENEPGQGFLDQEQRLQEYKQEIRDTRRQREGEWQTDRNLLKNIIQTWREMKSLRQLQKFNNTTLKLQIRKEATNKAEDEEEWEADITDEIEEISEDTDEMYAKQMEEYQTQLDKFKKQKLAKKEARLRQKNKKKKKKRRNSGGDEIEDVEAEEDPEQEEKDLAVLEAGDLPKPEKPKRMDNSELRNKILEKYNEIRRKPGENVLIPELTNGATITPTNQCARGEQARRSDVQKYKIWVKVLFNEKEVSKTPPKPIGQDFVVRFVQILNIEIIQWPESIKFEVYETTGLGSTMIAEVYTAIPESNITSEGAELEEVEFSGAQRINHAHEGVGSGVPFSFAADGSNKISLMTTGILSSSVVWAVDSQGSVMVPPTGETHNQVYNAMKGLDAVAAIGVSGMADMDKLSKWITQSRLDPNDPNNADLMYLLRPIGGGDAMISNLRMPEHFRLEQLQEEFNFCTEDDIENSRRFKMIQLRERGEPSFQSKQIPLWDKEVPEEVFDEYEKKKREEDKLKQMNVEDSHRVAVKKFMQQVREQVMLRYRIALHEKKFDEVIKEESIPNISTFFPKLLKAFEPRRNLRPVRKPRKMVPALNLASLDVKILVNIVRAFGIPIRTDSLHTNEQPRGGATGVSFGGTGTGGPQTPRPTVRNIAGETQVRPFVEVMFQRHTEATSVADGPNPSWNEELAIPFKPPNNDFSPTTVQTINDILYFNLFDEYIVDVVQDDRERGSTIHRRIEKRWLGTIKIPFSTIYFNTRIEGTFRIEKPPVLLGYTSEGHRIAGGDSDLAIGHGDHTYLTMFVTIEPPLKQADPVKERFDSSESEEMQLASEKYVEELKQKYPKREYKATVIDINGKSVFVTKFLRAIKPPAEFLVDGAAAIRKVARFVSLIPFVSDSVVFPGICDIWSTCDQFLQMKQGDEEEHAMLLANFFLSMGKKAFLLLGSAIPEGPTAYVLVMEEGSKVNIWNASTAECFSSKDNYCPVQSIGCLVSPDNIYSNIQPNDVPSRVSYDLNNTSNWKPFFSKSFPYPSLPSVQDSELHYYAPDNDYISKLQDEIERTLKNKIMEWRPRYITRWNRYCVQAFRRLLVKLEENHGEQTNDHAGELDNILGSYKMSGFPINQAYTEIGPIVDSVFATGVQNYESSEVEFALAVYIHPYPCDILSVWVYVANLVRKR